jgi:astacin
MKVLSILLLAVLLAAGGEGKQLRKRSLMNFGNSVWAGNKWPNARVPYMLSDSTISQKVRDAIQAWEQVTCVRFEQLTSPSSGQNYLDFKQGSVCQSTIGMKGGAQEVTVTTACPPGTVMNLIGHALGFYNTHQRPDRDQYIRVLLGNLKPGFSSQFDTLPASDIEYQKTGYDLGSVMHVGAKWFATSYDVNTINTVDPAYQNTIGQRLGISFLDAKAINLEYCSDRCAGSSASCQHGGYANPNSCGQCQCPSGLGGSYCGQVQSSSCGGELVAGSDWQTINGNAAGSGECYWHITASGPIQLRMDSLTFDCNDRQSCAEYVEIKYSGDFEKTGPRFCCQNALPGGGSWSSQTGEVVVIYHGGPKQGKFQLSYKA